MSTHSHEESRKVYYAIFGALMVCTALTIGAAKINLGPFNAPVALAIATFKAILVILFFMHVKDSPRLTKVTVFAGFFWLGIMFVLTMGDFLTRIWE